jgi:hypothetical protein
VRPFARAALLWFTVTLAVCPGLGRAADTLRQPLLAEGKHTIFQRVIARPGATLYLDPQASGGQSVLGFSVFYVYERCGAGNDAWVEIGRAADGQTQGWIRGSKLIDWKDAVIAAFTNPAGRGRTLFFRQEADLLSLLRNPNADEEADRLRADSLAYRQGPVIALEPENYINITRKFYFFPVLNAREMETGQDNSSRLFELISAPGDPERPPSVQDWLTPEAMRLADVDRPGESGDPDVLRSFANESDFAKPELPALKLYQVLTRNELTRMTDSLASVISEALAHRIDERVMFARMHDLMTEYLAGPRYHSVLASISESDWVAMGGIAQRELLTNVEMHLTMLREYRRRDLWVDLGRSKNADEAMIAIPLDAFP